MNCVKLWNLNPKRSSFWKKIWLKISEWSSGNRIRKNKLERQFEIENARKTYSKSDDSSNCRDKCTLRTNNPDKLIKIFHTITIQVSNIKFIFSNINACISNKKYCRRFRTGLIDRNEKKIEMKGYFKPDS